MWTNIKKSFILSVLSEGEVGLDTAILFLQQNRYLEGTRGTMRRSYIPSSPFLTSGCIVGSAVLLALLPLVKCGMMSPHYYINEGSSSGGEEVRNIPLLLQRIYEQVGHDRFRSSWKEFNSLSSDEQDNFLMEDLTNEQFLQLSSDFEQLAEALATDPTLLDLFTGFEQHLDLSAFRTIDQKLNNHLWWGRLKFFLFRKLQKLARQLVNKPH